MPIKDLEKRKKYEREYRRKWIKGNRERHRMILRETSQKRREKLKIEIFRFFEDKCAHCGFTDIRALQIDHVNGGGYKEKRSRGSEEYYKMVLREIKAGSKEYQCLCANCNWIKRHDKKEDGNKK